MQHERGNTSFCGLETLEQRVLFNGDPLAILPLGDSITEASGSNLSYRYYLWEHLVEAGIDVDFVGTQDDNHGDTPNWPDVQGQSFDRDHEGHWGYKADRINDHLDGYLSSYTPDIALVHLGTNDINGGQSPSSTVNDLRETITILRADNPDVTVFLSQIIPLDRPNGHLIDDLNALLPDLADEMSTSRSQVIIVDQYSGFNVDTDTDDGVHPDRSGEQKMAQRFYDAIADFLDQTDPAPNPTPSPGPNDAPDANAGPDQTHTDYDGNGSRTFALDGTSSSDPDGTIASYRWRINGSTVATGARPSVSLPVGTHFVQLTVTDNDGATDTDTVRLVANPQPDSGNNSGSGDSNNAGGSSIGGNSGGGSSSSDTGPQADAGSDRTYVTSNGRITLAGSATRAASAAWSVVSAPGTVAFADVNSPTSQATLTGFGTFVLRFTVTGNDGTTDTDTVRITISQPGSNTGGGSGGTSGGTSGGGSSSNATPTANAGSDRTYATANGRITLAGQVGNATSAAWSVVSAPGGVAFANPNSPTSQATLTGFGTYTLRLTASNGETTRTDTVRITITQPGSNTGGGSGGSSSSTNSAPTVNAGPDRSYTTSNGRLTLTGQATDDGLPGTGLTTRWSVVSAPSAVLFDSVTSPSGQVTLTGPGTYVLRLTASDGVSSRSDDVEITIYRP